MFTYLDIYIFQLPAAEQRADPPETARRPPEIEPMEMEEGRQR